jgi:hypothetical protein
LRADNVRIAHDEPADWAIIFVHGIGQQEPGSTLARFGQPLVEYARANSGSACGLDAAQDAWHLTLADGRLTRDWVLLELHWDDLVTPPSYRQLLRWMVLVVPWILHSDALLGSHRRPSRKRDTRSWSTTILRWYLYGMFIWGGKLMWTFLRGMALLLAGVVAQLFLTVVGVLGLIPALRGPARWAQRALIGSVGDSFAYLYDEATWTRIERRLVDTVQAVNPHVHRIAVVTHSQGTAVMHRALADGRMPDRVAIWVSLGSGLQKLAGLRETNARTLAFWAVLRGVALAFVLASMPFWGTVTDPETGEEIATDLTAVALIVGVAILVAPIRSVRRVQRESARLLREPLGHYHLRWLDLYTFHDPVPGGPIPGTSGEANEQPVASVEVYNEGSFLRDHSAYFENPEHVVARVYDLLEPPCTLDPFVARQLVERRARRVRLRRVLSLLVVGTTFGVSAPVVRVAPWPLVDIVGLAAAGLLSHVVVTRAWRRWNSEATAQALVDPGGRTPLSRVAWILGGWTVLALLMLGLSVIGLNPSDLDGVHRFVDAWGRLITLSSGTATLILLVSLDFRAYEAARRPGCASAARNAASPG